MEELRVFILTPGTANTRRFETVTFKSLLNLIPLNDGILQELALVLEITQELKRVILNLQKSACALADWSIHSPASKTSFSALRWMY